MWHQKVLWRLIWVALCVGKTQKGHSLFQITARQFPCPQSLLKLKTDCQETICENSKAHSYLQISWVYISEQILFKSKLTHLSLQTIKSSIHPNKQTNYNMKTTPSRLLNWSKWSCVVVYYFNLKSVWPGFESLVRYFHKNWDTKMGEIKLPRALLHQSKLIN